MTNTTKQHPESIARRFALKFLCFYYHNGRPQDGDQKKDELLQLSSHLENFKDSFFAPIEEESPEVFTSVIGDYTRLLLENWLQHFQMHQRFIVDISGEKTFQEIHYIDQFLLELGLVEMALKLRPRAIVVNEYIQLSKEYGQKNSYKLLNKVLDSFHP